jgi:hypothetical protein
VAVVFDGTAADRFTDAAWYSDSRRVHSRSGVLGFSGSAGCATSGRSSSRMKILANIADFVRRSRRQLRSGELSRESLQVLRVEWKGNSVECDWLMRPVDPFDKFVPHRLATENQTLQALRDALRLREIVLRSFPSAGVAQLRMFRADDNDHLELVVTGNVNRSDAELPRVPSLMMRAKMCGFRFSVAEGTLRELASASLG